MIPFRLHEKLFSAVDCVVCGILFSVAKSTGFAVYDNFNQYELDRSTCSIIEPEV